ncbi:NAD-dependent DNA ligase LigA [Anaerotalea alkaliphila]|uniref:DNA ligase n=1 Tax=Anaerotalea alkaliphila TaxID=2662126 RepID=A0A7X5HVT1_9FIRM|nr:NAD-dependent DNA ligase LigA [Anaerotalea alkaliphila]NDL67580.1 NAD-dependent DNA ligase LigA [Anaerotalea alkaliphila]
MDADTKKRMSWLVKTLNHALQEYHQHDSEVMSNYEYDLLYDELLELENRTGQVLAGSPTQKVGYAVSESLPKERHETPMLSLDKTKDREALKAWLKDQEGLLSYKLDGLTIVLTFEGGALAKAVTRGNGTIGEVVTGNARTFINLPLRIPFQGKLVVRGEAVIAYGDFEKINRKLPVEAHYKNPRNLCSGSIRQLNSQVTAERMVRFYGFELVDAHGEGFTRREDQLHFLEKQGIETVPYRKVVAEDLEEALDRFAVDAKTHEIGSDGLVLAFNDLAYGTGLGSTSRFPKHSIAFKWEDEVRETTLQDIEWSASRTGLLNPIALFEPVDLEGSRVGRASLHNVSVLEGLALGLGDRILVYKANMIIPQIAANLTRSGGAPLPEACPVCGGETRIRQEGDVRVLTCPNALCPAKQVKAFAHFVSRDALNVEGLSQATVEKLVQKGLVQEYADFFRLEPYADQIRELEGFGEKSCRNLLDALEKARKVPLPNFLYALGIPHVGLNNAKLLAKRFRGSLEAILKADLGDLGAIDGFGQVRAEAVHGYFHDPDKMARVERVLEFLELEAEAEVPEAGEEASPLAGMAFVITGSLERFKNRKELEGLIESLGGKVTGSVTKKTDYLLNNDTLSASGKNKKAKELGIPILSEGDFLERWVHKNGAV